VKLNKAQWKIVEAPLDAKTFLSGPAGCGKTTVGVERLRALLASGLPANSILVLTPQRTLQAPYETALRLHEIGPGGQVTLATVGGLSPGAWYLFLSPAVFYMLVHIFKNAFSSYWINENRYSATLASAR
jgi:superfamily I DNA/RNA helicase